MMGTNFYATTGCPNPCAHCAPDVLHIGKRSGGWTFGFQAYPELGLTTRKAWQAHLRQPGVAITDEYDRAFTPDDFDALVDRTREPWGPNKLEPARRDGWNDWLREYDDRHYRDPDGWDFWRGEFC